jgi:aminoglycoside phosphotransferase (APT) family kinase protein
LKLVQFGFDVQSDFRTPGRSISGVTSLPGLDIADLQRWLDAQLPGIRSADLDVALIAGGKSNLTYRVSDGTATWALRRPPLGHVLPTAHDMGREFRVIDALYRAGFAVPEAISYCPDPVVLGAPFYLMSFVPGAVLDTPEVLSGLSYDQAAQASKALVQTLAALHSIEPEDVGLGDFGRPAGFMQRQVRRWAGQWSASETRPVPVIDKLIALLAERVPEASRATVVHGDYRLTNVLYPPNFDAVAAVVDWEMATLGDPLSDVGLLFTYHELSEHSDAIMPVLDPAAGFLSPRDLLGEYATAAKTDLADIDWYIAFGYFKLAVISEGIAARHLKGETVGEGFEQFHGLVPQLVEQAHHHVNSYIGG